jgi:ABC-type nitrate/sulfonate/bicarbonate transport system permease component
MITRRKKIVGSILEVSVTAAVLGLFTLWSANSDSFYVASTSEIGDAFSGAWLFDRFSSDFVPTLVRFGAGYGIAAVLGIGLGLLLGLFRVAHAFADPLIQFMRAVPPPALVPVAVLLLGMDDVMNISIIAFVSLFPILLNTIDGVRRVDPVLLDTARVYRIEGLERFVRVIVPGALPQIFVGLRVSLPVAVIMVVITEFLGSSHGVGTVLQDARGSFDIPLMWATIVLLGLVGFLLGLLFSLVEERVLGWHRGFHKSSLG